jgi:hypothetical protein
MSKFWFTLALLANAAVAHAGDAFAGLKCDAEIGKALVGKRIANGPVDAMEKQYAGIGLKHEGSEELSEPFNYEAWTICGGTYHFIVRKDIVTDVVRADHSKAAPAFLGACDADGKPTTDVVLAILKPGDAKADKLPATAAWRVDEVHGRFVVTSPDKLMCPRNGIATADGGP